MLDSLFKSIISSQPTTGYTFADFMVCTVFSIVLGLIIAGVYMYKNTYTKSFAATLALLPAIVQVVIALVNGNLGAGVAVAGAFSLVRFRSAQGSAKEICFIFFAMTVGLATGMGYIGIAAALTVIVGALEVILNVSRFGEPKKTAKDLKITVPENLEYHGAFEDLFKEYTDSALLVGVKTTNMGSLFRLHYKIALKDQKDEKKFIDALRCRNGNLEITCNMAALSKDDL